MRRRLFTPNGIGTRLELTTEEATRLCPDDGVRLDAAHFHVCWPRPTGGGPKASAYEPHCLIPPVEAIDPGATH